MKAPSVKREKISHFLGGIGISFGDLRLLQRDGDIEVFHHPELGRVFVIAGEVQHVEAWAPLYHEPLVHLPASFVKEVKNVLILGGGTLYAAFEALKYSSVKRIMLVEKDEQVVHLARAHYEHAQRCLRDRRLTIIRDDAYKTLLSLKNEFDIVLNDGAPLLPLKPKLPGATSIFEAMQRVARPGGVCADTVHRHVFERRSTLTTLRLLRRTSKVAVSLLFIPEYHGVLHALTIWGSKRSHVTQAAQVTKNRLHNSWKGKRTKLPCQYFDPRFLSYYLYLPSYFLRGLGIRKTAV